MDESFIITKVRNPKELCFQTHDYVVNKIFFQSIIYSPNYDLILYFCDDSLLTFGDFHYNIKITIFDSSNTKSTFNSTCHFSKNAFFSRFSGLFDLMEDGQIIIHIDLKLKSLILSKSKTPFSSYQYQPIQKFNLIKMENIVSDQVYTNHTIIMNLDDLNFNSPDFNLSHFTFFISFPGIFELFGPIDLHELHKYIINSRNHVLNVFQIPKKLDSSCLGFFVEKYNDTYKEFFGVYSLDRIYSIFQSEYKDFTVNGQAYNPKGQYSAGTIVCAYHK